MKLSTTFLAAVSASVVTIGIACARHQPPATKADPPTTVPSQGGSNESGGHFRDEKVGRIELDWPEGWTRQDSKDFELLLVPADQKAGKSPKTSISLDVPDLPPHLPGLIPIGSVQGGYLDDLKKQVGGSLHTNQETPPKIPDAHARLVRSTWKTPAGEEGVETALLLVHADHVYILRGHSETQAAEKPTRAAFDQIAASMRWLGK